MGVHVIRMPDIGEGIAEVELVAWHVQPGDAVEEDQILADVMTDKATVEIPSPVTGRVAELGGDVGQMMAVGSDLIRIELTDAGAAPKPKAAAVQAPSPAPTATPAAVPTATPAAPPPAPAAPAPAKTSAAAPRPGSIAGVRPIASPSVRARAWELGIDLAQVQGSGTANRIVHADLDAFAAGGAGRPTPAVLPAAGAAAPRSAAKPAPVWATAASDVTEVEKIIGLRRKIAQRMQDAKRRIPHFGYVEEVDVTELEALRAHLNARWGDSRGRLNPLPFIVRAIVIAAPEFPEVNARFDDEAGLLTRYQAVHVGIATQAPAGLLVPVLRQAQTLDLWTATAEIARLAELAKSGKIARDELSGSTITITSLGRLGGLSTTPVINAPETAIIAVNRIAPRPVVRDGAIVARQTMHLSGSFDHRIVDGARAAGFMQRLRELIEHPATLFVE